jgi:hypothetical protein
MRVELDLMRQRKKLPVKNILWDNKEGKLAGRWRIIRSSQDVENFLDSIAERPLYGRRSSYYLARIHNLAGEPDESIRV